MLGVGGSIALRAARARRSSWAVFQRPGAACRDRAYSAATSSARAGRRWRRTAAIAAVSLGAGGFAVYNYDTAYFVAVSALRTSVAAAATCQVAWDYYRNFPALLPDDAAAEDRELVAAARSAVHVRAAEQVRRALMTNGGVYIKLGQHLAAMQHVLPEEWCSTMQALQDQNVASSLDDVGRVVAADTGQSIDQLFAVFDPVPIGVASLAQVHRAVLRETGEEVAVKVQHPMVRTYSDIDIAAVSVMFELVHSVFPDFKFMWLSAEMKSSLPCELDFRSDQVNADQAAWNFANRPDIPLAVPRMIRATERVLIMEYIAGRRCDDLAYLRQHGIDPTQVSRAVGRIFAEMTFVHGFLHCDPHPGNLFVRPRVPADTAHGYNFDLVLLDHGLYRQLTPRFRYEYAEMWRALMKGNPDQIRHWSRQLAGTDLYRLFAIILTGQSWSTIEAQSLAQTTEPAKFSFDALARLKPDILRQIADVLAAVPPVLLLVLKTNDLLRMIDQKLYADQPAGVQRRAQLQSWLRLSRYCLVAIRDTRIADARRTGAGPAQSVRRACRLLASWLRFWCDSAVLAAFSAVLSIEDMLARWRVVLGATLP